MATVHRNDALGRRPGICRVGCWAHAHREFVEVLKAGSGSGKKGNAETALETIGQLYGIEKMARKDHLTPDQIVALRQEKSKPILEGFHAWLMALSSKTPKAFWAKQ